MISNDKKSKFLEILWENPSVSFAARKVGIGRAAIYRWKKDNPDFRKAVDEAMEYGNTFIIELAEMVVKKKLAEGDLNAAKFVLTHTNSRYNTKKPISPPQPKDDNCRHCEHCGYPKHMATKEATTVANRAIQEYLEQCRCDDNKSKDQ